MHLIIVRTMGSPLDMASYNSQELGLARVLTKKGWRVTILLAGREARHEVVACEGGSVDVFYLTFIGLLPQFSEFKGWKQLLREQKPDIVQVHDVGIWMTYRVSSWCRTEGVPCVLIQGTYQPTQKKGKRELEILYNKTFGRITLKDVVAAGAKTCRAALYVRNIAPLKTFSTPIGLDPSPFFSSANKGEEISLSQKGNRKVLLYVGSLEKRRNPDFLIRVLSKLPVDYILYIIGAGEMELTCRMLVEELGLHDRCVFFGKLRQNVLPKVYETADLFLFASSYEIYGMVIMEAMYFGCPVVSSVTAGSESLINDGVDGCLMPKLDEQEWVSKIIELTTNDKIKTMSKKAKQKVLTELLWNKAAEKFEALYGYALQRKCKDL